MSEMVRTETEDWFFVWKGLLKGCFLPFLRMGQTEKKNSIFRGRMKKWKPLRDHRFRQLNFKMSLRVTQLNSETMQIHYHDYCYARALRDSEQASEREKETKWETWPRYTESSHASWFLQMRVALLNFFRMGYSMSVFNHDCSRVMLLLGLQICRIVAGNYNGFYVSLHNNWQ